MKNSASSRSTMSQLPEKVSKNFPIQIHDDHILTSEFRYQMHGVHNRTSWHLEPTSERMDRKSILSEVQSSPEYELLYSTEGTSGPS